MDPYAVTFSSEDLALIRQRLADYLDGKLTPFYGGFEQLAKDRAMFPVWIDFMCVYFLDQDGRLFFGDLADPILLLPCTNSREFVAVLISAEKAKTISLTHLIPTKLAEAVTCPECNGRGKVVIPNSRNIATGQPGEVNCPNCGTLGWYHPAAERKYLWGRPVPA